MLGFNLTIILLSECEYGKSISFAKYLSVSIQIMFTGKKKESKLQEKIVVLHNRQMQYLWNLML